MTVLYVILITPYTGGNFRSGFAARSFCHELLLLFFPAHFAANCAGSWREGVRPFPPLSCYDVADKSVCQGRGKLCPPLFFGEHL